MNLPIMAEATPSTLQVKLSGSRTPVMTNPSMWEAGFGNLFIFGYEIEVELSTQLENGNEVEYE